MIFDFQSPVRIVKKDQVGNKFYNLFLLRNELKLNVPDAFCITTVNTDKSEIEGRIDPQKKYAIRSSSNSEDMSGQSAAGMFKSFLAIQGGVQVLQKIRECFDSINSGQAQSYLKNKNNDLTQARVAVIVQEMLEPEKAGVLFTVNPVNNTRETVIEYMDGVAEHLMDGTVVPERMVFARSRDAKGSFLEELVLTGQNIEQYFKKPQDVEWAYQDGRFYILQARPVTTAAYSKRDLSKVWTRANIGEILPVPLTPLAWDIFQKVLFGSYRFGFYGLHDRVLTNIIHLIPRESSSAISPQKFNEIACLNLDTVRVAFSFEPWVSEQILNQGLGFNFNDGEISTNLKLTTKLVKLLKKTIFYIEHMLPVLSMERRVIKMLARKLSVMDESDTEAIIRRVSLIFGWHIAVTARSFSSLGFLIKKAGNLNQHNTISELLLGQEKTEFITGLEKLQNMVFNSAALKNMIIKNDLKDFVKWQGFEVFREEFFSFLSMFGHRSNNEFELNQQDWSENPEQLKEALLREKMKDYKEKRTPPGKRFKVINSFKVREDLKNLLVKEYRKLRSILLVQGRQLFIEKKLAAAEDIFYLKYDELLKVNILQKNELQTLKTEINNRKNMFLRSTDINIPFSFSTDESGNVIKSVTKADGALKGVGCSQGIVSGRAVHVFSLQDSNKLQMGDIMVTAATDPGWTPLFAKVSGVITEIGGILSHTATIAREFNIPMITGIQNLKTVIPDGKTIEMDGSSGIIKIMEEVT